MLRILRALLTFHCPDCKHLLGGCPDCPSCGSFLRAMQAYTR